MVGGASAVALLTVGGALLQNSLYTVEGGHRSILFSRMGGLQEKVYKEGMEICV